MLQSHSRLRGLPVDSLTFDYKVLATKWTNDDAPTSGKEIDFSHVAFQVDMYQNLAVVELILVM